MKETEKRLKEFAEGISTESYRYFGCHYEGDRWVLRVWAPGAYHVSVTGDFCDWSMGYQLWRREGGVFEGYVPGNKQGFRYLYRLITAKGELLKGDPYAVASESGIRGASIALPPSGYKWQDESYLSHRMEAVARTPFGKWPMWIYEMHPLSLLRHDDGGYASWEEIGDFLVDYLPRMGFTHVEIMGGAEYPFDGSWGYQVGAYYAPTWRHGSPDEFRRFIDRLHGIGIGVLLDWVPAHFPKDSWGLYEFDGTRLYEYKADWRCESKTWGTRYFDLSSPCVRSFLLSNAAYWLREFHLDGLRVDAVASTLYLDYDRCVGEWEPNALGDHRNLDAVSFWQTFNTKIGEAFPDALTVAEESTAWWGITKPVDEGGLGFSLKWNMGWANDMFAYLSEDPLFRCHHHKAITFGIHYAHDERFVLPVSHDEVVHGKGSLIHKISGNTEEKIKQIRSFLLWMATFPGKKMLFMGTEFAQWAEWDHRSVIDWYLCGRDGHRELHAYVRELLHFYRNTSALWERDFEKGGFELIDSDANGNFAVFRRVGDSAQVTVAVSFSGTGVWIPLPENDGMEYRIIFSTEGATAANWRRRDGMLLLPPFGGAVLVLIPKEKRKTS